MEDLQNICDGLFDQFERSFDMLREVIGSIPSEKWLTGFSEMFVPAMIAYHAVESLDFYFSGKTEDEFEWGYRFRGPWWGTRPEDWPTKEEIVIYLEEVAEKVRAFFESTTDDDLVKRFDLYEWSGGTVLTHLVYALRHTMHHQGQLTALQSHFGIREETWR